MITLTTSNCFFASLNDADILANEMYGIPEYLNETNDDEKAKALIKATELINNLNFKGYKTNILAFPRNNEISIPPEILKATIYLAEQLLDGRDLNREYESISIIAQKFGPVSSRFNPESPPIHIIAGIPSIDAWRLLIPYLRDYRSIVTRRVS